ncbi:YbaN family protein [Pseudomonas typographi]|uniref:YbaN family protein n=1 Tax=Pseudomonas typographi TaxID=2715964 RepID=UPI0016893B32|nr:YbaN family protein [Pseudomonas typographi]MBD1590014.1 DUF454 domain-containing protein [Pseudomonas typographi]
MTAQTPHRPRWQRALLLGAGWLSVALAVIGAFLPVMPTVPFLLLAAACFARSAPRFHRWLVQHPRLGPLIKPYLEGQGMPRRAKVLAIASLWLGIGFSCWLASLPAVRIMVCAAGVLATVFILWQKTRR